MTRSATIIGAREYIVSADMSAYASEGLRRASGASDEVHSCCQILNGDTHEANRPREASSKFIRAKDHIEFHDQRLWDLRKKRDAKATASEWRCCARSRLGDQGAHAYSLSDYLREIRAERETKRRPRPLGARRGRANQLVLEISMRMAPHAGQGKSMLTDECEMRRSWNIGASRSWKTDLGERIQQLDDEPPSHIVVPAVHKLRATCARVVLGSHRHRPKNSDVTTWPESQRRHTRPYFLEPMRE
jgi:L-lactate dehydrogenase complex protein LldF